MKYDSTKKAYGNCEGPFGIPMNSEIAKEVENILKSLPEDCKKMVESGPLRKNIPAEISETNYEDRTEVSIVTTDAIDRDHEIMCPSGINWSQWRKNPVVTWNHNYGVLPPARGQWVKQWSKDGYSGFIAKSQYILRPENWQGEWFADAVWHYVKEGYMPGKSIGFIPLKVREPTKAERVKASENSTALNLVYEKVVAIEYAICPVQSNPDAILQSIGKGITIPTSVLNDCGIAAPVAAQKKTESKSEVNLNVEASKLIPVKILKTGMVTVSGITWTVKEGKTIWVPEKELLSLYWGYKFIEKEAQSIEWKFWEAIDQNSGAMSKSDRIMLHCKKKAVELREKAQESESLL